MKSIKTLVPKKLNSSNKPVNKLNESSNTKNSNQKPEYYTMTSNVFTNESSHNLKQLSVFNPLKDDFFEVENQNVKLKIKASDILGEQAISKFNDTQLKIWDYILTQSNFSIKSKEIKKQISINIAELCDFLGLSFQTKNINKLKDDLKLISKVKLNFKYKGVDAIGNLFEINALTKKSEIVIFLGVWADTIEKNKELQTYSLINSKAYTGSKVKNGGDPYFIISRKIHELYKNNIKRKNEIIQKKGNYEITIGAETFIKCLLWAEPSLKKDTKKFFNTLIRIFEKIEKEQKINYDILDCQINGLNNYEKFLKTKFIFHSEYLEKEYKEKGYK